MTAALQTGHNTAGQTTPPRTNNKAKQDALRARVLSHLKDASDDSVLTFEEWCALNTFSPASGHRIKGDPDPKKRPRFVQLTPRRVGITVGENRRWQASRTRD